MRSLILIAMLFAASLAAADDASEAGAKLYEYFEVFNAKDKQQVANIIYSTPVHIGGGDGHRVLAEPLQCPNIDIGLAVLDQVSLMDTAVRIRQSRCDQDSFAHLCRYP